MDPESALVEIFSDSMKNSPIKAFHEPDAEESPPKVPLKVSRFNLKVFQANSEKKRVPINSYDRVQSHSSARSVFEEDSEQKLFKKLFSDQIVVKNHRSLSRELPLRSNNYDFAKNKEIQQLNSKIKSLIKEKYELKTRIESQNSYIQQFKGKYPDKNDGFLQDSADRAFFEVTFKPKENWENPGLKNKRFPREVFRIPKNKQ